MTGDCRDFKFLQPSVDDADGVWGDAKLAHLSSLT